MSLTVGTGAPTTIVEPETATDKPNSSPSAPSEAVSSQACSQEPYTCAAPWPKLPPGTPTTIVAPETPTDWPSASAPPPKTANSLLVCSHELFARSYTYVAPWPEPYGSVLLGAPTTILVTEIATVWPKRSSASPSPAVNVSDLVQEPPARRYTNEAH